MRVAWPTSVIPFPVQRAAKPNQSRNMHLQQRTKYRPVKFMPPEVMDAESSGAQCGCQNEKGPTCELTLRAAWPISVIPFPYDFPATVHLRKSITFWVRVPVLSLNTCVIYEKGTKQAGPRARSTTTTNATFLGQHNTTAAGGYFSVPTKKISTEQGRQAGTRPH